MKKYFNGALIYAIAALCSGVLYRELTKWNGFTERTMLANAHVHLFALGTLVFLLLAFFSLSRDLSQSKKLSVALVLYNIGISGTAVMMIIRGITEVLGMELASYSNSIISGVSGLFHITAAAGIVRLIIALKKACIEQK